jgi:hypothetical protein
MIEIPIVNEQTLFPEVVPIPIFTEYFHAVSLGDKDTNIFNTNVDSFELAPLLNYQPYDVVEKILRPLENKPVNPVLKRLDGKLLVPLEGLLVLPDAAAFPGKRPLVLIGHGNHDGYIHIKNIEPTPVTPQGEFEITVLEKQIPSFLGYHTWFDTEHKPQQGFQQTLAAKGIASYSLNLNIVNTLENNEKEFFQKFALDFNQRILLFFLHLKLLKIIAGETVTGNELPIKFFAASGFKNLQDALQSTTETGLIRLRDALQGKVDFTKLGFMGHSRGADAVSRLPAYFFNGTTLPDPTFPTNPEVNRRIRTLSEQIGRQQQEVIKCVLALEPTASINKEEPGKHGYVIDNNQTMYFVVVGTHDEDVSMDPVRIYEFPKCPKVMIAINGATHKRFNTFWAPSLDEKKVGELKVSALSLPQHKSLLNSVCGSCFTGTLGGNPADLLPFTKKTDFVSDLPLSIDFQSAWKFGFPFAANTPVNLKVTSMSQESIQGRGYEFEQELTAFFIEKNNEGTVTIRIPIDPNTEEKLSNFNHFSFRFAKGFDVASDATRVEEKNFTIQFFENDTPVGKPITGGDIEKLKLQAFQAFDLTENNVQIIEYSILMQTAEIALAEHLSSTELPRITRIDINIIPDVTKAPPNSTAKVYWTIGVGVLGAAIGVAGGALWNSRDHSDDSDTRKKRLIGCGLAGTAVGVGTPLIILRAQKHAFVFNDFLLTNRQIPVVGTP